MTTPVSVVGIGADGWAGLTAGAQAAISGCEVLMGSARQLALVPPGPALRVPWPRPLLPSLPELLAQHDEMALCVLASGDPMFYGIGVTLAKILGPQRLRVIPQPSSAALACARLGWPVAQTPVVSVVGRPLAGVLAGVWPGARLLVLSEDGHTPARLAALLDSHGYGQSTLVVLEQLGGPAEAMRTGIAAGWSGPPGDGLNIIALTCVGAGPRLTRNAGLPDSVYGGASQLTKRHVRALTLSALAPAPGELLWDVGAGTGSVSIEWCRTNPSCAAIAFEHNESRRAQLTGTARALGVTSLRAAGPAPEALRDAPQPQAVFIGGGLTKQGVLESCWEALPAGGRLVANAVTTQSETLLLAWADRYGGELAKFQIYQAAPLGGYTAWRPQLPVTQWSVTKM